MGPGKRWTNAHDQRPPCTADHETTPPPQFGTGSSIVLNVHKELMPAQHIRHVRGRGQRPPVCQPTCLQSGTAAAHSA